jgi:hypothetical protein
MFQEGDGDDDFVVPDENGENHGYGAEGEDLFLPVGLRGGYCILIFRTRGSWRRR